MGGTNPLFILAVYAPGIAAILLVWWHYGAKGLARFFLPFPAVAAHGALFSERRSRRR